MIVAESVAANQIGLQLYSCPASFRPFSALFDGTSVIVAGAADSGGEGTTNRRLQVVAAGDTVDIFQWAFLGWYTDGGTFRYVFDCGLEVGP